MVDQPFFIIFDAAAIVVLGWWLWKLLSPTHHFEQHWRWRLALLGALALSIGAILFVLRTWASFDVVDDPFYIVGYLALGVVCSGEPRESSQRVSRERHAVVGTDSMGEPELAEEPSKHGLRTGVRLGVLAGRRDRSRNPSGPSFR